MAQTNQMLNNVNTDNILTETLSNFNTSYIIDIVRNSINIRFRPYSTPMPSLNAIEMNFQSMLQNFTDHDQKAQIMDVRMKTYDEIISVLCQYFGLEYVPNQDIDNYTVAYFLYNVLVSRFSDTIIEFYVRYIVDHQDDIVATLKVPETKEGVDPYSRKLYGTSAAKLGRIHSQIGDVIDDITAMDITFDQILKYGFGDPNGILVLSNTIKETGNVFGDRFAPYLRNISTRADIVTYVKLELQQFAMADINIVAPIKEEEK